MERQQSMENTRQQEVTAREVLVFDSSTFIEEAGLTSKGASALKHYLCRRGMQLVVPRIVVEECERTLTERAKGKKKQVEESLTWLARFCGRVSGWSGPSDEEIAMRAKALANAGALGAVVLLETEPLRKRAELRHQAQLPPSHRRASLADCKIWEHCLELMAEHDVVFVARDGDFLGYGGDRRLHPHLRSEAHESAKGRRRTFHQNVESLLSELRSEISQLPKEVVFDFVYASIAGEIQELKSNSGCHPKAIGDVTQTLLTTDHAEVIEVRLKVQDTWESPDGAQAAVFRLSGTCRYRLVDGILSDLRASTVQLLVTQPDGSLRAVKGSYQRIAAAHIYAGAAPIQPEPTVLE